MAANCANCDLLKNQCLELRSELALLNSKLDKLLESVCVNENCEVACQTEAKPNDDHNDIESQTSCISYIEVGCQADMIFPNQCQTSVKTMSGCSQTESIYHLNVNSAIDTPSNNKPEFFQYLNNQQVADTISHVPLPDQPFSDFDILELNKDIVFNQQLGSRSACYFGDYSYSYGIVKHNACPLPQSGNYLCKILEHVQNVLPGFQFNSVLLTKYQDGSDFLNFHSDNESVIVADSGILTISLGATRVCKFRKLPVSKSNPEHSLFVRHGDAVLMSRRSQDLFQHSILPDDCQSPRVSITLRLLKPCSQSCNSNSVPEAITPQSKTCTLYIGDSMLRNLDCKKLSSSTQDAIVLSYPGATAGGILARLQNDPAFKEIDPGNVKNIVLFGGTNNVDRILNIPSHQKSNLVFGFDYISEHVLNQAKTEISNLVYFLHSWCNTATINILNILPRESLNRNIAINALNYFIKNLSLHTTYVTIIPTELHRSLFSFRNGNRKSQYFASNGTDNVHLSNVGIVRLAKYLKYFVHHC